MLYDVFICHASADKADFVQPLVAALQNLHVQVWCDEESVGPGDSLRQAIDNGLSKSRLGVVVLSGAFFARNWPKYELDALAEREMAGNDKVLLSVWHGVGYEDVYACSAALAEWNAASSSQDLDEVMREILSVIRPQGSPLVVARDVLLQRGLTPPVITDEYWLDVVEAASEIPDFDAAAPEESVGLRWGFPLLHKRRDSRFRGERIAWTALQLDWIQAADTIPIIPLTPIEVVLEFIDSSPGLFEMCLKFPKLLAKYAPQLTIPGCGGGLEKRMDEEYRKNPDDDEWSLRRKDIPTDSHDLAYHYFHGSMIGPDASPYEDADHVFWLLSSASAWLPAQIHSSLLSGMKSGTSWLWESLGDGPFWNALFTSKGLKFPWTPAMENEVRDRIREAVVKLRLPETDQHLLVRFKQEGFPDVFLKAREKEGME